MKLAHALPPTLRVDALGSLAAIALTALAAAVAVGPRILAPAPSHAQQNAELNARLKTSFDIDRQTELAQRALADVQSQAITAVKLKPASITNQRLVDIDALAGPLGITITRLIPGPPPPLSAQPPTATAAAPAAPPAPALTTLVPIRLAGTGTYPDISRFLHALHDTFRDTALSSLKLSTALEPMQSENPIATFSIDLSWYAAPDASDGTPPKH